MFTLTVPSPHSLNNLSSLIPDLVATVALKWIHSHYYSCCCVIAFITTILAQWAFALNVFVCASVHFHVCLCFSEILQEEDVSFSLFSRNIDPNWAQEGFPYYTSRSVESCFPGVMFLWFPSVIFELSKLQRKHGVSHQWCRVKNLYRYLTWSWLAVIRLLFFTLKL